MIRYKRGELVSFAMNALGMRDSRELQTLEERSSQWARLKGLLKGLKVIQKEPNLGRLRTIESIIPDAGEFAFTLREGGDVTVKVVC